jgi:hypothetical protein
MFISICSREKNAKNLTQFCGDQLEDFNYAPYPSLIDVDKNYNFIRHPIHDASNDHLQVIESLRACIITNAEFLRSFVLCEKEMLFFEQSNFKEVLPSKHWNREYRKVYHN